MKKWFRSGILLVVMMLAALCLSACGKKEISFNEYVVLETDGYDGEGTTKAVLDFSKLMSDHVDDISSDNTAKTAKLLRNVGISLDKSKDLKNGDVVKATFDDVDMDAFAEVGITPVFSDVEITVAGLTSLNNVSIFDGIEFAFDGEYSGYANVYMNRIPSAEFAYMFDFDYENGKFYKNGDSVVVTAKPSEYYPNALKDMAAKGYRPESLTYEYKISGLAEITEINPFDYIYLTYYGSSGSGYVVASWAEGVDSNISSNVRFEFDKSNELSNGDTIKMTASSWYSDADELAKYRGITFSVSEMDVVVDGLEHALYSIDEISDETLNSMIQANLGRLESDILDNWTEPASVYGVAYAGSFITKGVNNWNEENSNLYLVYKLDVDSRYDDDHYVYWYAEYDNVRVSNGEPNVNAESYVKTSKDNYSINYGETDGEVLTFETGMIYYIGFASLDEMVAAKAAEREVIENKLEDVEMTRLAGTSARIDYVSFGGYRYDPFGTETSVDIVGDGTYTIHVNDENTIIWGNNSDAIRFAKLGVVIPNIGKLVDVNGIDVSDVVVNVDGVETAVKKKNLIKGNVVDYVGNADDYAFYLVYDKDENGDGTAEVSAVDIMYANDITITFTLSGIGELELPVVENESENSGVIVDDGETENVGDNKIGYTVQLVSLGESKIQVIKALREIAGIGLKEAKDMAESAPTIVIQHISYEAAEDAVNKLKECGAFATFEQEP